jgi:hypothetical protein
VEFRRSLGPDGELPADLLDRLAHRLRPAEVARRARRRFVATRRPILSDQLDQIRALRALTADTLVERRRTVIVDVESSESRCLLLFEGREVSFPMHAQPAVLAVASSATPFTARQLPGQLDEAGRLVLIRRLVREGLVRVVPGG